jgi:alpha-N-arabinofuranosidase
VGGTPHAGRPHPAPFKVTYVEIGNEDGRQSYEERFAQFCDAIRARYPHLVVSARAGKQNGKATWTEENF